MAKMTDETVAATFAPHLQDGEELTHWAFGVKQPNMRNAIKINLIEYLLVCILIRLCHCER